MDGFCVSLPLYRLKDANYDQLKKFFSKINTVTVILKKEKKKVGSTEGMILTAQTSENLVWRVKSFKKRVYRLMQSMNSMDYKAFFEFIIKDSNNCHSLFLDTYPPLFYMNEDSRKAVGVVLDFNKSK